jgi:phosphoribosylanthranilate isomerase
LFKIKICGITRVADSRLVALAGADAIGLNFYPGSSRCIDLATADQIVSGLPSNVAKVGVFVNAPTDEMEQIADRLALDWIQLHGDETPDQLAAMGERPIIRAVRFGNDGPTTIAQYLEDCQQAGRLPDALLVDAAQSGEYGGTGKTVDWQALAAARASLADLPMILAGGLTPFTVEEAIATTKPVAVDVASGVESKPGNKDPLLVRAFVNAARKAFAAEETGE